MWLSCVCHQTRDDSHKDYWNIGNDVFVLALALNCLRMYINVRVPLSYNARVVQFTVTHANHSD